jgi:hypothetical protein
LAERGRDGSNAREAECLYFIAKQHDKRLWRTDRRRLIGGNHWALLIAMIVALM